MARSAAGKIADRYMRKKFMRAVSPEAVAFVTDQVTAEMQDIADQMKRGVRSKSGALVKSIRVVKGDYKVDNANVRGVSTGSKKGSNQIAIVAGDKDAFYAAWVEFGSAATNGRAWPFFYPAWRSRRAGLRKVLRNAWKKFFKAGGNVP